MQKTFEIKYETNFESNEYLRCLWSQLRLKFGKTGWQYNSIKDTEKQKIYIGELDLGKCIFSVYIQYHKKGCIKSISFNTSSSSANILNDLETCIAEAKNYKKLKKQFYLKAELDKKIIFNHKQAQNVKIENNKITIKIDSFDIIDAKTFANSKFKIIKGLLSFDSLLFINNKDSGISNIREERKDIQIIETNAFGEILSESSINENYSLLNLNISDSIFNYISAFLNREYNYENDLNSFEKSVLFFADALFYEELSKSPFSLDINSIEYAIVSYMSSLEMITLNDLDMKKCIECGQDIFSISKKINSLTKEVHIENEYLQKLVKKYYSKRSKFVHTGLINSAYNYVGKSIPLLSTTAENGVIIQTQEDLNQIKRVIKSILEYKMNKDFI